MRSRLYPQSPLFLNPIRSRFLATGIAFTASQRRRKLEA
jgi:hypothetical protein